MEFKEVVGSRRSIRFFDPDKPVEREKIQMILETARLASCAVNAHWLRAIVVERDKIPPEKLNQLKTPVAALTLDLAPVHIYFFVRPRASSTGSRARGSRNWSTSGRWRRRTAGATSSSTTSCTRRSWSR